MDKELVNSIAAIVYAYLGHVPNYGHDFERDKSPEAQSAYQCAEDVLRLVDFYRSQND